MAWYRFCYVPTRVELPEIRNMIIDETNSPTVGMPLLCWDIANPMLTRQRQLASDVQAFSRLKANHGWQFNMDVRQRLANNQTVVITERANQIIWTSSSFVSLTGYQPEEMLGKSPSLLQGPLTSSRTKTVVRKKLINFETVTVTVQNYRKDKTPYWCRISIFPLFNSLQECTHFIAFEKAFVTDQAGKRKEM